MVYQQFQRNSRLCHSICFQYHVDTESWTSLPSPARKRYQKHQLRSSKYSLPAEIHENYNCLNEISNTIFKRPVRDSM